MSKARDLANAGTALTSVSATELGYVDGVTSAIQTQLDAKIAKTLTTTTGDTIYASSANTPARLGIGTTGQVLTVASGVPSWATIASGAPTLNETVFTSSGTFTPATGVTKVWVEIIGGGGGGGCSSRGSGGGSAGGTINQQFTVTPGTGVTVTVGAGGAAQSNNGDGNAGTGSVFSATTADGGAGGAYQNSSTINAAASMGGSAFGRGQKNRGDAAANSGAGGGGSTTYGNGGAGGSGRVTVRWLS